MEIIKNIIALIIVFSVAFCTVHAIEYHREIKPPPKHEFLCVKVHEVKSRHNVVLECIEVNK